MITKNIKERYLFNTFDELMQRVATEVSKNETDPIWRQKFYKVLRKKQFCPAGNTLMAGVKPIQPNCSILGTINDENQEIIIERAKQLWKHAIGVGFSFETRDPVETLKRLSYENQQIDLKHRPQRGNMGVISVDHPRLKEFIEYKYDQLRLGKKNAIYNFNISVAVTNEFMEEVFRDSQRKWKSTDKTAKEWLEQIAYYAHQSGDPGIVFIDRVQDDESITKELGRIKTAVPCGEQFLHDNETCNLGAINLNSKKFTIMKNGKREMNWRKLKSVTRTAVRFLDNVVDLLQIPDKEMKELSLQLRRIGLGVTGWAELLKKMNYGYASQEALQLADSISKVITEEALSMSRQLAKEKGPCKYCTDRRNISVTCIQPTGGITLLLGNKGFAIEPFFEEARYLHFKDHIKMQAAWQKNIQQAISKTINMPEYSTVNDIKEAFIEAYKMNCKGVTVYRENSRTNEPMQTQRCKSCEETGMCTIEWTEETNQCEQKRVPRVIRKGISLLLICSMREKRMRSKHFKRYTKKCVYEKIRKYHNYKFHKRPRKYQ